MLNRSLYRQAGSFFLLYSHNGQLRHSGCLTLLGNSQETMAESVSLSSLCQGSQGKPTTDREKGRPLHQLHTLHCKLALMVHLNRAYLFNPPLLCSANECQLISVQQQVHHFVQISKMLHLWKWLFNYHPGLKA